ncbi:hypothetical protein [Staphylococcus auricularis]|mgnify:CR=1 FL=1|uniref:hypothetical protein n=1 Tax=Staphylococcus auricularis TaxID=29379 RepID=UPI00242B9798|nr:hypothetical protein [Staphylococcus auricularis]
MLELYKAGYKDHEIQEADIYELLRIITQNSDKKSKTVKKNESLIGAITGRDPRK